MGLPQVSTAREDVPTGSRTPVLSPSHFERAGACDLDGLPGGISSGRILYPSIGNFNRRTALNDTDESNGYVRDSHVFDGPAGHRGLKIDFRDANSRLSHKLQPASHMATMRVVGFESGSVGGSNTAEIVHPSAQHDICHSPFAQHELQARKTLLSLLKNVLARNFHGEELNIASGDAIFQHSESGRKLCSSGSEDNKKANARNLNFFESHASPTSRCSNWSSEWDVNKINSNFFTDGPILGSKEPLSYYDHLAATAKLAHSPLSLSPLSPRHIHKVKIAGSQRHIMRDIENDFLDLKEKGGYDGIRMLDVLEETNRLHDEFDAITPRSSCRRNRNWGSESAPTSPRVGYARCLSLPVRRPLVVSFEESLLSGRLSYGKDNQIIDGFLALLNIVGGSFSPPTQKLPFAVTSIDEDSSLLYYSSIDLAGRLASANSKSPKLQRSLSNNDSRSAKSRLRIPAKGRIQLVVSNPEKTPLHSFFCNYNLTDMPSGTKTFMRQKVTLSPTVSPSNIVKEESKASDTNVGPKAQSISCGSELAQRGTLCSEYCGQGQNYNSTDESEKICANTKCCSLDSDMKESDKPISPQKNKKNSDSDDCCCQMDNFHSGPKKSCCASSKINECSGGGVLRYALHLRFLCPASKKSSKSMLRCKSDPSSAPYSGNTETDDRRFYLYNDLRVVFPQRHSDSDEGELRVEHDFPADPKYFDVGN